MSNAFTRLLALSIAFGGLIGSGFSGPIPSPEERTTAIAPAAVEGPLRTDPAPLSTARASMP
ncbi:hypothetical protein PG994_006675 [Apiospora phragmitis]|uniref:Uncharacterized protein n=1 Tax=Apiospora phragmitis TaxID=2905665 RepID=A0ABR1VFQ6_9PEZI